MDPQHRLFDRSPNPPARAGWTAVEFFAGVGLARMGLERAGWQVVFANDIEPTKRRMHDGHFGPSPHYVVGDIHDLATTPDAVPSSLLAHASFPCTDLSLAGSRRGLNEGESSAFWGWIELLREMGNRRPPLLLIENVTGLLSSNAGDDFRALIEAINGLGYSADAMMVDAAHFTPQSRPRLFVVGVKNPAPARGEAASLERSEEGVEPGYPGLPHPSPPPGGEGVIGVEELEPSTVRPAKLVEAIRRSSDLEWTIAPLPEPPPYGAMPLTAIVDRLPADDPQWWNRERAEYLLGQMSEKHRGVADAMIAGKQLSYGGVFRRVRKGRSMAELRTDGLAGCLRTPKGGSGRQILFEAGRGAFRVRLFNPDECARLMGAAGYRVTTSLNQALFGFGDAVCVDAVAWVAEHRLNPLAERMIPHALPATA